MRFYVDDGVLVEVRFFQDERRLRRAIESLTLDHFLLLAHRGPRDPSLLEAHKRLEWSTCLEVLGWVLDTDKITNPLPPRKSSTLRQVLADWPQSRHSTTCKEIAKVMGPFCMCWWWYARGSLFLCRDYWRTLACLCLRPPVFRHRASGPGVRSLLAPSSTVDSIFGGGSLR